MQLIYRPGVNRFVRSVLRPIAPVVPRKLRFPVYGPFRIQLEKDKSILLNCNPTSYLSFLLFWGGVKGFEYKTVRIFMELARKSEFIFDIGANIGYYSLVAARINPKSKVFSFEPMPSAYKYLKANVEDNQLINVRIESVALSDTQGRTSFYAVKNRKFPFIADHLNGDGTINPGNKGKNIETFDVTIERLDDFVLANSIPRIDLIKIDTEASEHLVFSAGQRVLREFRPIVQCEVLPGKIEKELEAIFKSHDYRIYQVLEEGLVALESFQEAAAISTDFYLVPSEKEKSIREFLAPKTGT